MFNKGTLTAAGEDILLRYFYGFLLNILVSPQCPSDSKLLKESGNTLSLKIFAPRLNSTIPPDPVRSVLRRTRRNTPAKTPNATCMPTASDFANTLPN